MEQFLGLLPLVAIVLVFWLLVIRPANRRQKNLAALQRAVQVGDRVMLSSGIYGTVRGVADDRLEVEIADGVVIGVARAAIASREESGTPAAGPDGPVGDQA